MPQSSRTEGHLRIRMRVEGRDLARELFRKPDVVAVEKSHQCTTAVLQSDVA